MFDLLSAVNAGKELLGLKEKGDIVKVTPNSVHFHEGFDKDGNHKMKAVIWTNDHVTEILKEHLSNPYGTFLHYPYRFYTSTFQPSSTTDKDSYLDVSAPTTNHDGETIIVVQPYNTGTYVKRIVIGFDVSSIFPNQSVTLATLTLYLESITGAGTITINAHSISRSWTATGCTWNKYDGTSNWGAAGGDFGVALVGTSVSTAAASYDWVIPTATVAGWETTNNGLLLKGSNESLTVNDRNFASGENGTAGNRPKMVINYILNASTNYLVSRGRNRFRRTGISLG